MISSSLTDNQRQDLAIFAGGDADEATASRAQLLLVENAQALEYFEAAHELIERLDKELSRESAAAPAEPMTQERARRLADQIRARARRRRWIQRPWALAAAIALIVSTAGVIHLVSRNRETVTAYKFPMGFGLGKRTEPDILRLRPTQELTLGDEVGVILLPRQTEVIVAPLSSLRYRVGAIDVLVGDLFVRSPDFEVLAGRAKLRIAGEAVISVDQHGGAFVEVHSGTATIHDQSGQVVREGQHAELNPIEVMTIPLAKPSWLRYGRERRQEIK